MAPAFHGAALAGYAEEMASAARRVAASWTDGQTVDMDVRDEPAGSGRGRAHVVRRRPQRRRGTKTWPKRCRALCSGTTRAPILSVRCSSGCPPAPRATSRPASADCPPSSRGSWPSDASNPGADILSRLLRRQRYRGRRRGVVARAPARRGGHPADRRPRNHGGDAGVGLALDGPASGDRGSPRRRGPRGRGRRTARWPGSAEARVCALDLRRGAASVPDRDCPPASGAEVRRCSVATRRRKARW